MSQTRSVEFFIASQKCGDSQILAFLQRRPFADLHFLPIFIFLWAGIQILMQKPCPQKAAVLFHDIFSEQKCVYMIFRFYSRKTHRFEKLKLRKFSFQPTPKLRPYRRKKQVLHNEKDSRPLLSVQEESKPPCALQAPHRLRQGELRNCLYPV